MTEAQRDMPEQAVAVIDEYARCVRNAALCEGTDHEPERNAQLAAAREAIERLLVYRHGSLPKIHTDIGRALGVDWALWSFAGYLSGRETLPPTRGSAYDWQDLVREFCASARMPDRVLHVTQVHEIASRLDSAPLTLTARERELMVCAMEIVAPLRTRADLSALLHERMALTLSDGKTTVEQQWSEATGAR